MLEEEKPSVADSGLTRTPFEALDQEEEKNKLMEKSLNGYDLRMVYAIKAATMTKEVCFSLYNSAGTFIGMTENLPEATHVFRQYDLQVCRVH